MNYINRYHLMYKRVISEAKKKEREREKKKKIKNRKKKKGKKKIIGWKSVNNST